MWKINIGILKLRRIYVNIGEIRTILIINRREHVKDFPTSTVKTGLPC